VAETQSIKNNKLCKTNPISEKPKMNLTSYATGDYENNSRLLKMAKQTQTNPTCSELVEPILSASGGSANSVLSFRFLYSEKFLTITIYCVLTRLPK
jgi:hypothetical protein